MSYVGALFLLYPICFTLKALPIRNKELSGTAWGYVFRIVLGQIGKLTDHITSLVSLKSIALRSNIYPLGRGLPSWS